MPQSTGFLSLPREIRDEIYNYLLISPTNLVTAIYPPSSSQIPASSKSTASSSSSANKFLKRPPRSHLHIIPSSSLPNHSSNSTTCPKDTLSGYALPSLSICRVNRQIHQETRGLFYEHNALYTDHPFRSTSTYPSLLRTLKAMGQTSSRLLEKVVIEMPMLHSSYKFLGKVLQSLSSRARHGHFRSLELHWSGAAWEDLFNTYNEMRGTEKNWLILESLVDVMTVWGKDGTRFEISVHLLAHKIVGNRMEDDIWWISRSLGNGLNGSGAKVYWGEVLVLEKSEWKELQADVLGISGD